MLPFPQTAVGFRTVDPRRPRVPSAPPSLRTTPVKAGIKPSSTYIYSTPPVFQSGMGSSLYGSVSPVSQSYNMSRGSPGNLSQSSTPQGGVTMNMVRADTASTFFDCQVSSHPGNNLASEFCIAFCTVLNSCLL